MWIYKLLLSFLNAAIFTSKAEGLMLKDSGIFFLFAVTSTWHGFNSFGFKDLYSESAKPLTRSTSCA